MSVGSYFVTNFIDKKNLMVLQMKNTRKIKKIFAENIPQIYSVVLSVNY
jgi:hypothetical protein